MRKGMKRGSLYYVDDVSEEGAVRDRHTSIFSHYDGMNMMFFPMCKEERFLKNPLLLGTQCWNYAVPVIDETNPPVTLETMLKRINTIESELEELRKKRTQPQPIVEDKPDQEAMYVFLDDDGQPFIGVKQPSPITTTNNNWMAYSFMNNRQRWGVLRQLGELISDFSRGGRKYFKFYDPKEAMSFFYDKYCEFMKWKS
jgi:hypothetical protein